MKTKVALFLMMNLSNKKTFKQTRIRYSNYKASKITLKKAKQILVDLLQEDKSKKVCEHCLSDNFNYVSKKEFFICNNPDCSQKTILFRPLHNCRLNLVKLELLLCMIIDMQQIDEIYLKMHLNKVLIRKWRSRFLEQIIWQKYKLDKDILDVREIYGSISWQWR